MCSTALLAILINHRNTNKVFSPDLAIRKSLEICGQDCQYEDIEIKVVLVRPDGIVVLSRPTPGGLILKVINVNTKSIKETFAWPYVVVGGSIITSDNQGQLTKLKVLSPDKKVFQVLQNSELPKNQTYDTGITYDIRAEWDIATSSNTLSIGVYQLEPELLSTQKQFRKVGERTFQFNK